MNHKDIVKLVNSMHIQTLTEQNFDEFAQSVISFFGTYSGLHFNEYNSPGKNEISEKNYDFSKGKPKYHSLGGRQFLDTKLKNKGGSHPKWINVIFDDDTTAWGIGLNNSPLKFGIIPDKALYIADSNNVGTEEFPFEQVYTHIW